MVFCYNLFMTRQHEAPYDYDPGFGELDRYCDEYEWYAAGGTDEPPNLDDVPEKQRETAQSYANFLDWKYEDGLETSVSRHASSPEYFRSMFRVIQGGLSED